MADTGNPWFIPFAEPSDLVRDWPALSSAVGTAVAAGLSAAGNAGIGSNVVQTVKTDTFTVSGTTLTEIPSFTATITPTSDTSKILVICFVNYSGDGTGLGVLYRDATQLFIGDAAGSRTRATVGFLSSTFGMDQGTVVFLDSPNTTSPVTYSFRVAKNTSGTVTVNRQFEDADSGLRIRAASSITAVEVKA
jgi:hypothetical protein